MDTSTIALITKVQFASKSQFTSLPPLARHFFLRFGASWPQSPRFRNTLSTLFAISFAPILIGNDPKTMRRSGYSRPALNPSLLGAAFAKALSRQRCNRSEDGDATVLERLVVHRLWLPYAHSWYDGLVG